jgi:hypothetical protein
MYRRRETGETMRNPEEGLTEFLASYQFSRDTMKNLITKRKPVPNTELLKQRVRVSFDFDVTVNDAPIHNSGNDDDFKQYDLALLRSLLTADKAKLLDMMIDAIGSELGLNSPETFMVQFLPQIDPNCHALFSKAIDALRGDAEDYWRHALPLAAETIFACFDAEFVSSDYKIVGE